MEIIECIKTRRSRRRYLNKKVPDEVIKELIDAARHAPSSKNLQPWEFIIVKNQKTIEKISSIPTTYNDYRHVKNAPAVIVVCAHQIRRYEMEKDALFSACVAAENLLLAAHALGLGACWTFCKSDNPEPEKAVKELLDIPKDIDVLCLIPIGYPDRSERLGKKTLKEIDEIIHSDKW